MKKLNLLFFALLIAMSLTFSVTASADVAPAPAQIDVEYSFKSGMDCQGNVWHERVTTITYSNGMTRQTTLTYPDSEGSTGFAMFDEPGPYGGCAIEWF